MQASNLKIKLINLNLSWIPKKQTCKENPLANSITRTILCKRGLVVNFPPGHFPFVPQKGAFYRGQFLIFPLVLLITALMHDFLHQLCKPLIWKSNLYIVAWAKSQRRKLVKKTHLPTVLHEQILCKWGLVVNFWTYAIVMRKDYYGGFSNDDGNGNGNVISKHKFSLL